VGTPGGDDSGGGLPSDPAGIGQGIKNLYDGLTSGKSVGDTVGDDLGSAIASAFKGAAGPITTWVGVKEASLLNSLNELINTAYYGLLALIGGLVCMWGLYEVGKDAGVNLGEPAKAAAGVASLIPGIGKLLAK
jgi:hypothetical protein